jgi:histidyl-tRNA synthetase
MKGRYQAIKGMPDVLPTEVAIWQYFEAKWQALMRSYGYFEIRLPLLETTSLFKRSIGEITDIVEKEMFSFEDKEGDSLTLRPEGTAACVRAALEHSLIYNQTQRLWYMGPMFRYEKPQLGRYRQFHQVGVEAFGWPGPDIDAEHLIMMARFWKILGLSEAVTLEINSLGSKASRSIYREKLVAYLSKYIAELDQDSQRRLTTNPLRILDSKNPALQKIILEAPKGIDYLDGDEKKHFETLQERLTIAKIPFVVNSRIVRGLDYYNKTVYEWTTARLGAQGTLCAGGRYDALVGELEQGGLSTPAVGFAVGIERVLLLLKKLRLVEEQKVDVYLISVGEKPDALVLSIAEMLRENCPKISFITHCGGGNFKNQFKKADKSGAQLALIIGESELQTQTLSVKFLREEREQLNLAQDKVGHFINEYFMGGK